MSITFVGDVHGWSDRLERVLGKTKGEVVFVGDLIDRGPDSAGVVRRVKELCNNGFARCIMGNHEWAMLRALGADGGPGDPDLFEFWVESWGGEAVLRSYRAKNAATLRAAMGDHLPWLAGLPWILQGQTEGITWLAVHAGLHPTRPIAEQIARLERGFAEPEAKPLHLFSKDWLDTAPKDLAPGTCVISGHTPLPRVVASKSRVLCDTSGGMPNRPLSAVILPTFQVVTD